mmetsp:Transcript_17128/g.17015  ORF Transcript_17128/g.17015 Transcript_17128/m.17015 type:complete len:575 (+) Transcript_17128:2-1726(+)
MSSAQALEWKERGNAAFQQKNYQEAIECFTKALEFTPNDHVFYSNRSACYASLEQYDKALEDAVKCVQLKPDWVRGYTRKGLAEFYLGKYKESVETYKKGLEIEPGNAQLTEGLQRAEQELNKSSNPMANLFTGENLAKLMTHPKTRGYFQQQDFIQLLTLVQNNPNMMQMLLQDPRVMDCLGVLIGFDTSAQPGGHEDSHPHDHSHDHPHDHSHDHSHDHHHHEEHKEAPKKTEEKKAEKNEAPKDPNRKLTAEEEKELGNTLFKNKKYEEALEHYIKALEINPDEITYINNKAACYFSMGQFDKAIELCDEALAKGREVGADLSKTARALSRKGLALVQLGNLEEGIEQIKKSLMEFHDDKLKFTLRDLEKQKKKKDELAYINPEIAETHNNQANELFKNGNFPGALVEYDEAVKRNPTFAKYYSNRAACYIKLMEFPRALTDINKAVELDPKFTRAWIRKGNVHYNMKEYHKALEAYEEAEKLEPNNDECKEALQKTMAAIQSESSGVPDEERIRHAMADPEIQNILKDPQMSQVLKDISENPMSAGKYMTDPKIRNAINKLIAAGVIRTG